MCLLDTNAYPHSHPEPYASAHSHGSANRYGHPAFDTFADTGAKPHTGPTDPNPYAGANEHTSAHGHAESDASGVTASGRAARGQIHNSGPGQRSQPGRAPGGPGEPYIPGAGHRVQPPSAPANGTRG